MTHGTSRFRHLAVSLAGAALAMGALEGAAVAYPHWQLTSGTARCNACHYSPAGGGLVTSYGRSEAGDTLSTFQGNGGLLHGAVTLPKWLSLGGDLRGAFVGNDVQDPGGPATAFFPMQAEVYGRMHFKKGFSLYGNGGMRGQVREHGEVVPSQNYQPVTFSQLISREHYLMWMPRLFGPYLRAGRFFAPYGLRMAEHILYVRRDLGFNYMEESYGLSGGYLGEQSELHLTAFAPDLVRQMGGTEWGGAASFERRILADAAAVGAQARLAFGADVTRAMVGATGKLHVEPLRTLFLAEASVVRNTFAARGIDPTHQLVGLVGFSLLPVRGLVVTVLGERNQLDLRVRDAAFNATTGLFSWFPYPHVELQVMGRLQMSAGADSARTFLAQLHYYL